MSANANHLDLLTGLGGEPTTTAAVSPADGSSVAKGSPPRSLPAVRLQAIDKVGYSHAAMIDMILANPAVSQNALANHFKVTPSWISQVMSSDAFQMAFNARRKEVVDPVLLATVEDNFKALVSRSQDILFQKLNKPAAEVPDQLVLRTLEIGSRAAGYGVKDAMPPGDGADIMSHLERLGGGLVALLERKKVEASVVPPTVEGDFSEITLTT